MKIIEDYKCFIDGKGIIKAISTIFLNPCFHSVVLYRLSHFFYKIKLVIIAKIIWYINRLLFHVDIDYRANLAGGLVLVHGLGVVIGSGVKSKGKLKVYQGVTIGGNKSKFRVIDGKKQWMPVLEDGVVLYTDCKLFGPIIIAPNTKINAASIITEDIINQTYEAEDDYQ
ncbi:MAG TPA: hypothetical protein GXX46_12400 [Peptococcaceae bacterium]|nr:hypothetical protein [Peptococcaceae bacterium]